MMRKKLRIIMLALVMLVALGACGLEKNTSTNHDMESTESMDGMEHDGSIPDSMVDATNPKFPVGSNVTLLANHMPGMKDSEGEVVQAYETKIYEVSYQPTTGGKMVNNHQWVVNEELDDASKNAQKGDTVILNAEHMEGMDGAKAQVDKVIEGTVYVVNYIPTDGGEVVENHMWVTEDELQLREK